MPHKVYAHACGHGYRLAAICPRCGHPGVRDGWDSDTLDQQAAYARSHGLQPIGPHRKLADAVFEGAFRECPDCHFRGFLPVDEHHCRPCDRCDTCGSVPSVPPEDLAEMRAKVLAKFPDSGHGPVPVLGPFARNLATGKVVSLADRPKRRNR